MTYGFITYTLPEIMTSDKNAKTVVVFSYGVFDGYVEGEKYVHGVEYGIHKDGCKDIPKTIKKYHNLNGSFPGYASWLYSGLKSKSGKALNGHFHSLQDALEKLYQEPINDIEASDNGDELIYTTEKNIEIFNCAK